MSTTEPHVEVTATRESPLHPGVKLERMRVVAELAGIDAIKAAVAAGLGVSIISRSALPDGGTASGLLLRRIRGLRLTRQMAAATLRGTPPLPATRQLLAALRPGDRDLARESLR